MEMPVLSLHSRSPQLNKNEIQSLIEINYIQTVATHIYYYQPIDANGHLLDIVSNTPISHSIGNFLQFKRSPNKSTSVELKYITTNRYLIKTRAGRNRVMLPE